MEFYIGTSGWHYDDWEGLFYPEKLPKTRWLEFYATQFTTVELNNSFYRLPTETAFQKWHNNTPSNFVFSVKASRFITHIKRLKDAGDALEKFITRVRGLGEKLGPILFQLHPKMQRDDERLEAFLRQLPNSGKYVVEFRHSSWLVPDVYEILRRHGAGFCVFDMPGLKSPVLATADFAYIRFHGPEKLYSGSYPDNLLKDWANNIKELSKCCNAVYAYFNNDVGGHAVENARTLRRYLEEG